MLNRRPEIDAELKQGIDKIASMVTDEVEYCRDHFTVIYSKLMSWGKIDSDYQNITLDETKQVIKDKLCEIRYVINLRKQQASKEVSNGK